VGRRANNLLRQARLRLPSPSGSDQPMSRADLAEAANHWLYEQTGKTFTMDANQIGKYERGENRWPHQHYRQALCAVLGAAHPAGLGFYPYRSAKGQPQDPPGDTSPMIASSDDAIPWPRQCDLDQRSHAPGSDRLSDGGCQVSGDEGDAVKRRDLLAGGGVAAVAAFVAPTRVVQALDLTTPGRVEDLAMDADALGELGAHYAQLASTATPASIYDELLSVRAYAGQRLNHSTRATRGLSDLNVATGYLSSLLAVVTSFMNDHAAALVWCADAERRSRESSHPELAGWAMLTRSTVSYYEGQAARSADLASRGQTLCQFGTVAYAKLAAQEMRARAMLGDPSGMEAAKCRAASAIAHLPPNVPSSGVFSITLDDDPPYTATSLLLVRRYEQAVTATARVIKRTYRPAPGSHGTQPSNYARSLLILGLAQAGVGEAAAAGEAGKEALLGTLPVWPTMVLASKLDQVLSGRFSQVPEAADFHECFLECARRTTLLTPRARSTDG
jgi:hypothetical protein